ncbi:MAG: peptidylprolyl isomerase [Bacteroidaceae bacterium]|nr:peptidylprolyl isomerase [Bacteroidaceae bacterium]
MPHSSIYRTLCAAAVALCAATGAVAQSAPNVIDEVIWVVGDEAILRSDVEKARAMSDRIQGNPYCVIPERLAIQKLFIHQAQADSVEVTDDQVSQLVEEQLNEWIQMATSREKLEEYRGMSITQIREELTEQIRNMQLTRMMRQRLTQDIKVTPAEVRYYFRDMPEDSLPLIPTQVEVEIIADHPRFRQEEIDRIKERLRDYTERINSGEATFAMLAKMYSDDKESARQGGEMDYMGRMELDPAFANVAWSLNDPKKVSKIVESQFGYHIIQLVDKRGDKLKLRHLLLRPHVEQADIEACTARLDSIAADIRAGKFAFEVAATELSDDKDSRANRGLMTNVTRDEMSGDYIRTSRFKMGELPTEIARVVETLDVGEVSKAFTMLDKSGKEQCAIIKLKSRIKAHPATITEDFQVLANIVRERRCDEFIDNWIREKQRTTYVRISPDWLPDCEFQYPGWVKE